MNMQPYHQTGQKFMILLNKLLMLQQKGGWCRARDLEAVQPAAALGRNCHFRHTVPTHEHRNCVQISSRETFGQFLFQVPRDIM